MQYVTCHVLLCVIGCPLLQLPPRVTPTLLDSPESLVFVCSPGIKELVHADHAFLFLRTNDVIQLQLSSNDTHLEHLIRADGSEKVWGFPGHSCFHHDTICLSGAEITSDQRYSAVVDSLIGYEPSGLVSIPILDPASLESDEVRRPALGVIEVVNEHMSGRKFTQKDVAMLQSFIKLLAITVKNAQHHDVQVETCDGIRVTCDRLDHSRDILFQLETDQMLTRVCDVAKSHLDAHQASLFVLDPETLHKRRQEHGLYRAGTDTQVRGGKRCKGVVWGRVGMETTGVVWGRVGIETT